MNIHPSEEQVKQRLKDLGGILRQENSMHQKNLRMVLQDQARQKTTSKQHTGFRFNHLFPSLAFALFAVLMMVSSVYQPYHDSENELTQVEPDVTSVMENTLDVASTGLSAPTFRSTFLNGIGKNTATQKEIDAYRTAHGDAFDENVRINLLSKEKNALDQVQNIMEQSGGFVKDVRGGYGRMVILTGRVPTERMESLRNDLQDFVTSEHFYSETIQKQNRIADVIAIDTKIQEVKDAIVILEKRLTEETNPTQVKQLEQELSRHRAYLDERERTKETVVEEVAFVDVSIAIKEIVHWWQARSYFEVYQSIAGYEPPGLGIRAVVNGLFVVTCLFILVSYTFWFVIPLALWWFMRKRRTSLFHGLD